ncbi:MAG: LL-diaminopimelate aminotransferase [Paludibacteraceae bacterium]|nr:LL-diaminopimelate aminotransferase [Paludibacteraceae bacterium]
MMTVNTHFHQLPDNYLFKEIELRTKAYKEMNPEAQIYRLGIGDVTRPLPLPVIDAMHRAVEELAHSESFRGYGPEEGYIWLRQLIVDKDYRPLGVDLEPEEVFISDGAGSDLGNLSELFDNANRVAILDPSYPAYVDSSILAGREIVFLPCNAENDFVPDLPSKRADIIYLCFPNNPTGAVLTREQLKVWVDYARMNKSIIIFDAAYEAFIDDANVPHSIYEIEGAKEVAIEVCSYSKTAGFTAVRCGWTVVPNATGLNAMWLRRQCTKYNGTAYVAQRASEATYTPEGRAGIQRNLMHYKGTAQMLSQGLRDLGFEVFGGKNAPYIWCRVPKGYDSWSFFDYLLNTCQIVCTPGVGFGPSGEGYVRFSAFSHRKDCEKALKRMRTLA